MQSKKNKSAKWLKRLLPIKLNFSDRSALSFRFLIILAGILAVVHWQSPKAKADTYVYGGSSVIWGKPREDQTNRWRVFNPTSADQIHWVDGDNRADATVVPENSSPRETKFNHAGNVVTGKAYSQLNGFVRGTSGSWVRTRFWGRGWIDGTVPVCTWTNTVQGDLGRGKLTYWKGRCQGKDPFHIFPDDLDELALQTTWDAYLVTGFNAETSVGAKAGLIELSVFYDTATTSTELLKIQLGPNGATVTADSSEDVKLFAVDALNAAPPQQPTLLSLADLSQLLDDETFPGGQFDGTFDQPLYIGIVFEDIPVPTVDLGNGAVARFRIETAAEDEGVAEEVAFQQDVDGYQDLVDLIVGQDINGNIAGDSVEAATLTGLYGGPLDRQFLLRFGNVEQVLPPDARIIDASLNLMVQDQPGAGSLGPFGVSQMLHPFDPLTDYATTGGFYFANGQTDRPMGNGFVDMQPGEFGPADVTQMVQNWVDGQPNHGFAVSSGTSEAMGFHTTGVGMLGLQDPLAGPALDVMFTDPPGVNSLPQQQVMIPLAGPEADMFLVDPAGNLYTDGTRTNPNGEYLVGGAQEQLLLVRPLAIFESQGGPVPDNAQIVDARFKLTTASAQLGNDVGMIGDYVMKPILSQWQPGTPFNQINLGPPVDFTFGMVADSVACFRITDIVDAWQQGQPMHGFCVGSGGTNDEWAVYLNSALPQQLPILDITYIHEPEVILPDSIVILDGILGGGNLGSLAASDNSDLSIRRSPSSIQSRTGFVVGGFSPYANPSRLTIKFENSVFARTRVVQTIELFDFATGVYEVVDSRDARRFSDLAIEVVPTGDLSRFVHAGTGAFLARVRMSSVSPRQVFTSNTDHFSLCVE